MVEAGEAELHFAANHPTGAGHFPGNPILPGALLLDAIWRVMPNSGQRGCTVKQAKFLHIVKPGETLIVRWQPKGSNTAFEAFRAGDASPAVTGLFA